MTVRIAKFIADSGYASRRMAEEMIASGRVRVNGVHVTTPVFFVDENDVVEIDGKKISGRGQTDVYAFHKPVRTMTTTRDPAGRRTIYDVLGDEYKNLKYIGRLDYMTSGLLLMTNDGELARQLTLPSSNIARTYIATVARPDIARAAPAMRGMTIDGIKYRPMKIEQINDTDLRVTVCEGKKNEIRIVLAACGMPVKKLHRISFGNIALGTLAPGKIKRIDKKTIDVIVKTL